jgi:hypothetical protein
MKAEIIYFNYLGFLRNSLSYSFCSSCTYLHFYSSFPSLLIDILITGPYLLLHLLHVCYPQILGTLVSSNVFSLISYFKRKAQNSIHKVFPLILSPPTVAGSSSINLLLLITNIWD